MLGDQIKFFSQQSRSIIFVSGEPISKKTNVWIRGIEFWTDYIKNLKNIAPTVKKVLKSIDDEAKAYGKIQDKITSW